jgi:hypothetical protein
MGPYGYRLVPGYDVSPKRFGGVGRGHSSGHCSMLSRKHIFKPVD